MPATLRSSLAALLESSEEMVRNGKRLESLPTSRLSHKPKTGSWSIAQVLDHLNRTNVLCISKFEEALGSAQELQGEAPETKFSFSERVMLKLMSGEAKVKIPVPPIFEPEAAPDPKAALRRFLEIQRRLCGLIERSDRFDLAPLKVSSPVSERMRAGYLAYLTAIVRHEHYHWGQIEAILTEAG